MTHLLFSILQWKVRHLVDEGLLFEKQGHYGHSENANESEQCENGHPVDIARLGQNMFEHDFSLMVNGE